MARDPLGFHQRPQIRLQSTVLARRDAPRLSEGSYLQEESRYGVLAADTGSGGLLRGPDCDKVGFGDGANICRLERDKRVRPTRRHNELNIESVYAIDLDDGPEIA